MEHEFDLFNLDEYDYLVLSYSFEEYYSIKEIITYGNHPKLGVYPKYFKSNKNEFVSINPFEQSFFYMRIPKYNGFNHKQRKFMLRNMLFDARVISQEIYSIRTYRLNLPETTKIKNIFTLTFYLN